MQFILSFFNPTLQIFLLANQDSLEFSIRDTFLAKHKLFEHAKGC